MFNRTKRAMRRVFKYFDNREDLRLHYQSVRQDLAFCDEAEGRRSHMHAVRAVREVLWWRVLATWCDWRGHDYEPDGRDNMESGGEGFSCVRCGAGFTAWH